jgi:type I restriction enzyme, R subunit
MPKLTEDAIEMMEVAALNKLSYRYFYGPDIAPDSENPQRSDFSETLLHKLMSGKVRVGY